MTVARQGYPGCSGSLVTGNWFCARELSGSRLSSPSRLRDLDYVTGSLTISRKTQTWLEWLHGTSGQNHWVVIGAIIHYNIYCHVCNFFFAPQPWKGCGCQVMWPLTGLKFLWLTLACLAQALVFKALSSFISSFRFSPGVAGHPQRPCQPCLVLRWFCLRPFTPRSTAGLALPVGGAKHSRQRRSHELPQRARAMAKAQRRPKPTAGRMGWGVGGAPFFLRPTARRADGPGWQQQQHPNRLGRGGFTPARAAEDWPCTLQRRLGVKARGCSQEPRLGAGGGTPATWEARLRLAFTALPAARGRYARLPGSRRLQQRRLRWPLLRWPRSPLPRRRAPPVLAGAETTFACRLPSGCLVKNCTARRFPGPAIATD